MTNGGKKRAPKFTRKCRRDLKLRMIDLDMTATQVAGKVGHDLAVVSKAINHGRYPRVLAKINEVLCA